VIAAIKKQIIYNSKIVTASLCEKEIGILNFLSKKLMKSEKGNKII
jgi:hypothetical protein